MVSAISTNDVTAIYESVLFRQPDSAGLAFWSDELDSGQLTAPQMIADFVASAEATSIVDPLVELYVGLFDRTPDIPGLQTWVSQADTGVSMSKIVQYFVMSQEFDTDYGTNTLSDPTGFVEALYQNFFARAADPGGLANWVAFLDATPTVAGEAAVILDFIHSTEFQNDLGGSVATWLSNAAADALADTSATSVGTASYASSLNGGDDDGGGSVFIDGLDSSPTPIGLPVGLPAIVNLQGAFTGATSSGNYNSIVVYNAVSGLVFDFYNAPTEAWAGGTEANSQVNMTTATSLANALDIAAGEAVVLDTQFDNGAHTTAVSGALAGALAQSGAASLVDWFQYGGNTFLAGALALNGSTGLVDWFQYGGNTYVVEAVNNGSTPATHPALGTHDVVVELVGLVDISHITMNFA